ncbi:MAG TPA: hypothetical protein VKA74_19165 [Myxococcota bacterium]|nr:hypothetical protein [Myxococcota bacterium]
MRSDGRTDPKAAPWALEPGPEVCGFCDRAYHIEAGAFCVDCDRPACPLCIVEVRESRCLVCPDCREEHR